VLVDLAVDGDREGLVGREQLIDRDELVRVGLLVGDEGHLLLIVDGADDLPVAHAELPAVVHLESGEEDLVALGGCRWCGRRGDDSELQE
jgi:hypothetical protein